MRERDEVRTGRKFTLAACLHEDGTKSQVEMKNTNIQNLLYLRIIISSFAACVACSKNYYDHENYYDQNEIVWLWFRCEQTALEFVRDSLWTAVTNY